MLRSSSAPTTCDSPRMVLYGTLGVLLVGVFNTLNTVRGLFHKDVDVIGQMIAVNLDSDISTLTMALKIGVGFSIFTVFTGLVGFVGVLTEKQILNCVYLFSLIICTTFFFTMMPLIFTWETFVEPTFDAQGLEFCNFTFHWAYSRVLGCNEDELSELQSESRQYGMEFAEQLLEQCGRTCAQRGQIIRRMGGCDLMHRLCEHNSFNPVGNGFCYIDYQNGTQGLPPMVFTEEDQEVSYSCCRDMCDAIVGCTGFSYRATSSRTECYLVAPIKPKGSHFSRASGCSADLRWAKGVTGPGGLRFWRTGGPEVITSDLQQDRFCEAKDRPEIIYTVESMTHWSGLLSCVAFTACLTACGCATSAQYALTTKRQGKKGGCGIIAKLICPCCSVDTQGRRFNKVQLERDEADGSSDGAEENETEG